MKVLLFLSFLILFFQATAHEVGNGGGGICIGRNCLTMAEAGLRIASPDEPFVLAPPKAVQALNSLAEKIPFGGYKNLVLRNALGNGKTFIKLDIEDPAKVDIVRQQYARLLNSVNSKIPIDQVKIFAFAKNSNEGITYLLPAFYELTPEQQAKILIHEAHVLRTNEENFRLAIELDGYIQDLDQDPSLFWKETFRIERWFELIAEFHPYHSERIDTFGIWLQWLKLNKKIIFHRTTFCQGDYVATCQYDISKILENYEITPGFQRFLQNNGMVLGTPMMTARILQPELQKEFGDVCTNEIKDNQKVELLYPLQGKGADFRPIQLNCTKQNGLVRFSVYILI